MRSLWVSWRPFSILDALSWSFVTSQHRSNSANIRSIQSSCTTASSMTTSAAVRLSPLSSRTSHPPCRCFCKEVVACHRRRSRFHCRWVYVGVREEKLGDGSRPNRGSTGVSSSTVSHRPATVSSHVVLCYELWISRLGTLSEIAVSLYWQSSRQHTNLRSRLCEKPNDAR